MHDSLGDRGVQVLDSHLGLCCLTGYSQPRSSLIKPGLVRPCLGCLSRLQRPFRCSEAATSVWFEHPASTMEGSLFGVRTSTEYGVA